MANMFFVVLNDERRMTKWRKKRINHHISKDDNDKFVNINDFFVNINDQFVNICAS